MFGTEWTFASFARARRRYEDEPHSGRQTPLIDRPSTTQRRVLLCTTGARRNHSVAHGNNNNNNIILRIIKIIYTQRCPYVIFSESRTNAHTAVVVTVCDGHEERKDRYTSSSTTVPSEYETEHKTHHRPTVALRARRHHTDCFASRRRCRRRPVERAWTDTMVIGRAD